VDVVYRSCNDNQIIHLWSVDGGGTFLAEGFGLCTMVSPAIASWGSGKLDVFVRGCGPAGSGEALFQKSYNGSSWTGWTGVSGGSGCLASGPGADGNAPEKLRVYVRGCDSPPNAHQNIFTSSWQGYTIFRAWPPPR
jgi:hypothetical protein